MPKQVKINGAWKNVSGEYVKINGVWKKVTNEYVKINGAWKQCFSSGPVRNMLSDYSTGKIMVYDGGGGTTYVAVESTATSIKATSKKTDYLPIVRAMFTPTKYMKFSVQSNYLTSTNEQAIGVLCYYNGGANSFIISLWENKTWYSWNQQNNGLSVYAIGHSFSDPAHFNPATPGYLRYASVAGSKSSSFDFEINVENRTVTLRSGAWSNTQTLPADFVTLYCADVMVHAWNSLSLGIYTTMSNLEVL